MHSRKDFYVHFREKRYFYIYSKVSKCSAVMNEAGLCKFENAELGQPSKVAQSKFLAHNN